MCVCVCVCVRVCIYMYSIYIGFTRDACTYIKQLPLVCVCPFLFRDRFHSPILLPYWTLRLVLLTTGFIDASV